jgi:ribose transport system ATP-binding protein
MIKKGVGMIPDDQKLKGLVLCRDIKENICLSAYDLIKRSGLFLNNSAVRGAANEYIKKLGIKSRGHSQLVGELSGGNQQKVVVAKWLLRSPRVIIMDEPTQGIDIGAKSDLYLMVSQLAAAGNGIIFITSDQSEIIGICDRVLVFHEGQINGQLSGSKINLQNIMNYAVGIESDGLNRKEILNNAEI